jgi:hypothetical protein
VPDSTAAHAADVKPAAGYMQVDLYTGAGT